MTREFDLIAIGSGPAGVRAAIQAAKLHRRAAIIEQRRELGGVSVNTGTIPSKTMREAILHLTGLQQRGLYGRDYRVKTEVTFEDIHQRTAMVIEREQQVLGDQLARNHVTLLDGRGSIVDPHTVLVSSPSGEERLAGAVDRDRDRQHAGASARRGVRRDDDPRLRPDPRAGLHPGRARRRRRGRDRDRVHVDVRGARLACDDRRVAADDARLLRRGDRRGAALPPARPRRDLPVRGDGRGRRAARRTGR